MLLKMLNIYILTLDIIYFKAIKIAPVTNILSNASGSNIFQPTLINWS